MEFQAVIFDMDGVLVMTDEYHYQTWIRLAAHWNGTVSRGFYERRLRGHARIDALEGLMEETGHTVGPQALETLGEQKDALFWQIVAESGLDAADGAAALLDELRRRGLALAVGSSSRNARAVLERAGLLGRIDVLADGSEARGKPLPDIFLLAAKRLGIPPDGCVVVEDAVAGIEAARRAGMSVLAVGPARQVGNYPLRCDRLADVTFEVLATAWQTGLPPN